MTVRKRLLFTLVLVGSSLAVAAVLAEAGFRLLYPDDGPAAATIVRLQSFLRGERREAFAAHPFVSHVYAPAPGINSLGFHDREHPREKSAGVTRIACIGGSTSLAYPPVLEGLLATASPDRVEVLSFAMPSWTTAESLVNLVLNVQDFSPDVLIIHHAVNDTAPRIYPGFRSDYSHWRVPFRERFSGFTGFLARYSQLYCYWLWKRGLREFDVKARQGRMLGSEVAIGPDGAPLPETAYAFERNIRTMIRLGRTFGARSFLVTMPHRPASAEENTLAKTIEDHNERLRELARSEGCGLIDLAQALAGRTDCFRDLVHFKPERILEKVAPIALALSQAGVVRKR